MSNLTQRVLFAAIAIPVALGVVYLGGWALVLVVAIAATLGARELYGFARRQELEPLERFGMLSAAAIPPLAYLNVRRDPGLAEWGWFLGGLWVVLLLSVTLWRRRPTDRPLAVTAVTAFGVLYPAGLAAFLIPIRHATYGTQSWAGAWMVFFPLAVIWICDTAAMFGGKAIGGPKLWPTISPGKTWAGSLAGTAAALIAVPVLNAAVLDRVGVALPLWQGLVFAGILSVVGQVGDLAESLYKREVGLKDSSSLIPGHGGVLDRLDSLYFVLPVSAALYRLFGAI